MLDFIRGIVRPAIAIWFAMALTAFEAHNVFVANKEMSPAFLGVATVAIGWWFYTRQSKRLL